MSDATRTEKETTTMTQRFLKTTARAAFAFALLFVVATVAFDGAAFAWTDGGDELGAVADAKNGPNANASGAATSGAQNARDVAFRYWKAPADAIDRWPWGSGKYFPIRAAIFDEWLRTRSERTESSGAFDGDVVASLRLDAKLDGDSLDGFGTLELASVDAAASNAPTNAVDAFPLDSFSFALSSFFERDGARKAFVGLYPDARLYLANPKNGAYSFRWTRRGTVDSLGTVAFDLTFPASPQTTFQLEAPSDATVDSSQGVVEKGEETERGARRWLVYLGGKTQTRLTVARATATTDARRKIGFQQETSHRLSLEGGEVVSRFVFDRSEAPFDEATLIFDDPLVPISIDWGGSVDGAPGVSQTSSLGTTKIKLRVPERREGNALDDLKIVAFYPLETKNERRLPSVRLLSDALLWKETICRLTVVRPVIATSTTPIDAVQAREPLRTAQEGQDFFSFKFFEPNAGVAVKLQTLPSEPAFDSATDALIVANEISAKTTLFFNCDRDDYFRLSVPLAPDWEVDAVQTSTDDQIVWAREETDGVRSLVVSFKTPPPPNQATRVVLSARYAAPFDEKIAVDRLCPIDLSNNLRGAHALALRAESPNQVRLTTRTGRPFSPPKTTPKFVFNEATTRDALPNANGIGRLYFGDQTADAVATLENVKSNYSAELSGLGELRETTFVESWKLRCSPATGSRVDRVVFFVASADERTVASDAPWTWSTSTEPDRVFVATRLPEEDAAALALPDDVAAFEIRLATSRSVPFELNLFQTVPATPEIQAPLLFLPEASIETAEFVVESPLDLPFWTRRAFLDATPAPLAPADEYEPLKSAFRYAPAFVANDSPEAPTETPRLDVLLAPPELDGAPRPPLEVLSANAWCWFEALDSFYEANGTVRRRASFFIENRGRASALFSTPGADASTTTRAVWLDDRRVPWSAERVDDETIGVRVALPPDRRFVCVGLEYYVDGPRLVGFRRLKPTPIVCDVPVLSGVWNAWIPPEYRTCDSTGPFGTDASEIGSGVRAVLDFFSFRRARAKKVDAVADRFLRRFGDEIALRRAVAEAKAQTRSTTPTPPSASPIAPNGVASNAEIAPTWGDVFGSPATLERLFAPDAPEIDPNADSAAESADSAPRAAAPRFVESPFGRLESPSSPFRLYVDRFYLARLQLTPTTPIARPARDPARRDDAKFFAARTLEEARLALLFVDDDLALLTTNEALAEFGAQTTERTTENSIRRVATEADARRFRQTLLGDANPRYVVAASWRAANDAISPWKERAREENAPGWTRTTLPLVRAANGVRVVDRYEASTLVLFCFIAFVAAVWRRAFATPSFFVATIGVCAAIRLVAPLELRLVATGASWGALCAFGFYFVRFCASTDAPPRRREKPRDVPPVREPGGLEIVARGALEPPPRADAADEESTQGFVDLTKLPQETPRENVAALPESLAESDASTETRSLDSARKGAVSPRTLAALAAALLVASIFGVASVGADDLAKTPSVSGDASASASARAVSSPPFGAPSNASPSAAPSTSPSSSPSNDAWREPYRVFVPIDERRQTVGEYYWIPEELHETIRAAFKSRPRERNWRIVDALYEGVVNYNGFAETTSLFNLKATYKVFLDAPNATISLPATQLVPDVGAKFDKQALSPIFEDGSKEFSFEIVDAEPGEHLLELTLVPPQFSDANGQISLPIPRVPTSRLELSVPTDAPALDVPNALGKVTRGPGRLVAELGPVDRLVLSKDNSSDRSGKTTVDVEQYLLMRTRPTQTDVRATFRFQAVGGKVQTLQFACDPLYAFSGYCQCDKAEIESIEPPTSQNDSMRVSFKKPISGAFALNVDFVARNFSGVGQIPLPQIATERARVSKSWLALAPSAGVECAKLPEATLSPAAFQSAWGAALDDAPIAVFDLLATPPGRPISIRSTPKRPIVSETATFVFRPTRVDARLSAVVDASTELFRLELSTPTPFVVDSISLTDAQGSALETPTYFLSEDGLSLLFPTPLKGKYSLRVDGGAKTALDVPRAFPTLGVDDAELSERFVRVYCAEDVDLERTPPPSWTVLDKSRADALDALDSETPKEGVYRVDAYELALDETDAAAPEDDATVVRVNNPQIAGRERIVLYRKSGEPWKAAVDYRLTVQRGRVERFYVAADESYSIEPLEADANFALSETRLPTGGRALVFALKTPVRSASVDFKFIATLKNDVENVRLPRFQLLPTSAREDVSGVRRFAFLPTREDATPIRWETQNLRPLARDGAAARETLQTALRSTTKSTAALALSGTATETVLAEEVPRAVTLDAGLTNDDFSVFETLGETGDATIASERDRLRIARVDHSFYWNSRREFFGTSSFSFRSNSLSECVLIVPPNYRILEATVNGARRRAERLDERRWRIDLDETRFGKRLEIAFQGGGEPAQTRARALYGRRNAVFNVDFPRVENAEPERAVWTCAFDSLDDAAARWQVYRRNVGAPEPTAAPTRRERLRATREPIPFSEANEILFRLCVGKEDATLDALEYDAVPFANSRPDDFARRRARWTLAWNQCESEIARFVSPDRPSGTLSERQKAALCAVDGPEDAPIDLTSTFDRWTFARRREILEEKKKLEATYRLAPDASSDAAPAILSPQGIWSLDRGDKTRLLFGLTRENVERIVVVAPPKRFDFFASPWATALFFLAATAIVWELLRTDAKARLFRCVLFGTIGTFGAFAFFALGWKVVGLFGVALPAAAPPVLASASRRAEARRQARAASETTDSDAESTDDGADAAPARFGVDVSDSDVGTTASASPPRPLRRYTADR